MGNCFGKKENIKNVHLKIIQYFQRLNYSLLYRCVRYDIRIIISFRFNPSCQILLSTISRSGGGEIVSIGWYLSVLSLLIKTTCQKPPTNQASFL